MGTLALSSCGNHDIQNMKDYTADFLGNQDGYATKFEQNFVKTLVGMAKRDSVNNVYMPFVIDNNGKVDVLNPIYTGNIVPNDKPKELSITEYPEGFSNEEITQMMLDGKKLPEGREWKEKDFINRFGYKEINQNGEISGTYILTEKGMKKQ